MLLIDYAAADRPPPIKNGTVSSLLNSSVVQDLNFTMSSVIDDAREALDKKDISQDARVLWNSVLDKMASGKGKKMKKLKIKLNHDLTTSEPPLGFGFLNDLMNNMEQHEWPFTIQKAAMTTFQYRRQPEKCGQETSDFNGRVLNAVTELQDNNAASDFLVICKIESFFLYNAEKKAVLIPLDDLVNKLPKNALTSLFSGRPPFEGRKILFSYLKFRVEKNAQPNEGDQLDWAQAFKTFENKYVAKEYKKEWDKLLRISDDDLINVYDVLMDTNQ